MPLDLWLAFVVASTVLLLIPGPTVLSVPGYAIRKGRAVAIVSAARVASGDFVALSAALLGLGALVMASATYFAIVKWIGAVYLIWLGIKFIRSPPREGLIAQRDVNATGVFGHAAAVTALNPKSIGFFIAFVPQFVQPEAPLLPEFSILIATFVALAALNALAYAFAADRLRHVIAHGPIIAWLTCACGAALIGIGILTATLRLAN